MRQAELGHQRVRFVPILRPLCSDIMHTKATIISQDLGGDRFLTQMPQSLLTDSRTPGVMSNAWLFAVLKWFSGFSAI